MIFGIMIIGLVIVYLRYRLVQELCRDWDLTLTRLNWLSFACGVLAAFGLSVVANFQVVFKHVLKMIIF